MKGLCIFQLTALMAHVMGAPFISFGHQALLVLVATNGIIGNISYPHLTAVAFKEPFLYSGMAPFRDYSFSDDY